jgi:GrpB-like predicted nucleotidyltransferase (UPF0157 family)
VPGLSSKPIIDVPLEISSFETAERELRPALEAAGYVYCLLFRDYLRAHPEAARRYADLKRELARRFTHDREAYTRGKADFVHEITELARATT